MRKWGLTCTQLPYSITDAGVYRPEDTLTTMFWDEARNRLVLAHSRMVSYPYKESVKHEQGLVVHKEQLVLALYNANFGVVVSIDVDGLVICWNFVTGEQLSAFRVKHAADERVTTAIFDRSERRLLVGSSMGHIWIYNWNSGIRLNELTSDMQTEFSKIANTISAAKSTEAARGHTVATGWDRSLYIWNDPPDTYALGCIRKIDLYSECDVRDMTYLHEMKLLALGMYDGVLNVYQTSGNWKRMHQIARQQSPEPEASSSHNLKPVDDLHKFLKNHTKSEIFDNANFRFGRLNLEAHHEVSHSHVVGSQKNIMKPAGDSFWSIDSLAINSVGNVIKSATGHPLWVTAGMDGYVTLMDCLTTSVRGRFDAGHEAPEPSHDGTFARLGILNMAVDPAQSVLATADVRGNLRTFDISTVTDEVIRLQVSIISANDLIGADADGLSDPYTRVMLRPGGSRHALEAKTNVVHKELNPVWNESFEFEIGRGRRQEIMKPNMTLQLQVNDYDRYGEHDELGRTSLDVSGMEFGVLNKHCIHLRCANPELDQTPELDHIPSLITCFLPLHGKLAER